MDSDLSTIPGASIFLVLIILMLVVRRNANEKQKGNPLAAVEVYLAYGRKEEAKVALKKFLSKNPGDAQAIELLNRANK